MYKKILILLQIFILDFGILFSQYTISNTPSFVENKGQWDNNVLFRSSKSKYTIQILKNSIRVSFNDIESKKVNPFELAFVNSNQFELFGLEKNNYYLNYFIGNDTNKWKTNVLSYKRLLVKGVYNNIDALLYFENKMLRFDFIIKPGGDAKNIVLNSNSSNKQFLSNNSCVTLLKDNNSIYLSELFSYQNQKGVKQKIDCDYNLSDNLICFELGDYDKETDLVIDPLIYSKYFGGNDYDYAEDMKVDKFGNVYIGGYTSSINIPTDTSVYQKDYNENDYKFPDAFISKFDSSGQHIFSTYIGGYTDDYLKAIEIDEFQNIYLTGYTNNSSTFPTTIGAFNTKHNGAYDIFVAKLNSTGSKLLFSSFIGSKNDDYAQGMCLDKSNNVYITGYIKNNLSFPVTSSAIQKLHKGENDAIVCQLSSNGDSLLYSTLLGGEDDDFGQDIVVDQNLNIVITGITRSSQFPTTSDALFKKYIDTIPQVSRSDIFISKINISDTNLVYSSFFGGSSRDAAYALEIDNSNSIYITGFTESSDYPVTKTSYDTSYHKPKIPNNSGDAFISKFSPDLKKIVFSTYIGGTSTDRGYDIIIDTIKNVYITGVTSSNDFPITDYSVQRVSNDSLLNPDAFVVEINPVGDTLLYGSYYGGSSSDIGTSLAVFKNRFIYLTGTTTSKDIPITNKSYKSTSLDTNKSDIFLSVFDTQKLVVFAGNDTTICEGQSVKLGGGYVGGVGSSTFTWSPSYGLNDSTLSMPIASPQYSSSYTVTVTDQVGYSAKDTVTITVIPIVKADIYGVKQVFKNSRAIYATYPNDNCSFYWKVEGGYIFSGENTNRIVVIWTDTITGKVSLITENINGCKDTSNVYNVSIGGVFKPVIIPMGSPNLCNGDTLVLDGGEGYLEYFWSDGSRARLDSITRAGRYWLVVADSSGNIGYSDTILVKIFDKLHKPTITYKELHLVCNTIEWNYQWYINGKIIPGAIYKNYRPIKNGNYQLGIRADNGCVTLSDPILIILNSISDYFVNDILIYPNPASDYIEIQISNFKGNIEFVLSDLFGFESNKIFENILDQNTIKTINTSKLASGVYLLTLKMENKILTFKISIIH